MEEPSNSIVDVAVEAGQFNTLLTAVEAAELTPTLQHDGPFTVFAPTDEAFDQLPDGAVTDLLQDIEQLTAVLLYHVVPGTLSAEEVADRSELETAGGEMLTVSVENGTVFVNGAQVIATDVEADNGVIHVVDGVLMP
ncbi:MAG: fasciclin domain-containing protein [Gemmatimonadales bacterium]|nr:MAG: fasciclin domain-containing protein [Gemmatimonadales bacterium]